MHDIVQKRFVDAIMEEACMKQHRSAQSHIFKLVLNTPVTFQLNYGNRYSVTAVYRPLRHISVSCNAQAVAGKAPQLPAMGLIYHCMLTHATANAKPTTIAQKTC